MLIAGGSFCAGSHDPYYGTLMPLGPSTPSIVLRRFRGSSVDGRCGTDALPWFLNRNRGFRDAHGYAGWIFACDDEYLPRARHGLTREARWPHDSLYAGTQLLVPCSDHDQVEEQDGSEAHVTGDRAIVCEAAASRHHGVERHAPGAM